MERNICIRRRRLSFVVCRLSLLSCFIVVHTTTIEVFLVWYCSFVGLNNRLVVFYSLDRWSTKFRPPGGQSTSAAGWNFFTILSNIFLAIILGVFIHLSERLETIGESAFERCASLTSITIPASVKQIGANTFAYCRSLETVVCHGGPERFGCDVFSDCRSLTSITFEAPSLPQQRQNSGTQETFGAPRFLFRLFRSGNIWNVGFEPATDSLIARNDHTHNNNSENDASPPPSQVVDGFYQDLCKEKNLKRLLFALDPFE